MTIQAPVPDPAEVNPMRVFGLKVHSVKYRGDMLPVLHEEDVRLVENEQLNAGEEIGVAS